MFINIVIKALSKNANQLLVLKEEQKWLFVNPESTGIEIVAKQDSRHLKQGKLLFKSNTVIVCTLHVAHGTR